MKHQQKNKALIRVSAVAVAVAAVLSPVAASAVSSSANTVINATVGSTISVTTTSPVAISLTPTSGGVVSSASDTVSVSTNNALGYTLTLADADSTASLVSGANTITAHAGTQATPTALAVSKWGYAVAGLGGFDATYSAETNNGASTSKWAGVPVTGSPNTLKTTATTASSDPTTVWYAAKVDTSKPNGVYTDTVTYTATTN